MSASRPIFDEAVTGFRSFLRKEGKADRLLWISRERITGWRTSFWVFRPEELQSDAMSRKFYDALRTKKTSIRIDTFGELPSGMLAYVEDYGGDGGHLNYGIATGSRQIRVVSSRFYWWIASLISRLLGESPLLRSIQIPKTADPVGTDNDGAAPRRV